ncbi:MAG: ParD-like family protein [Candidatus Thiodiazotropha sp. (ex Dulcina madagascariensis)]|nr:ParD-like family protein [Candidatus Thiodiazotropha sp. (ex Dulcina madagascariensis)]MCU7925879.1 ParD-like family protein [Candidatus Thiodiazotropha sp. (ex Dulcina madagascariensis)]
MAKAASPIRLQDELMQAASLIGEQEHRSAAEQVEYWASLGRKIARQVNPDTLLEVAAGLACIKVEPTVGLPVDPKAVFAAVEARRHSGALVQEVTTATPTYQASPTYPGYLEQIDKQGNRTVGRFQNGVFTPLTGQEA